MARRFTDDQLKKFAESLLVSECEDFQRAMAFLYSAKITVSWEDE